MKQLLKEELDFLENLLKDPTPPGAVGLLAQQLKNKIAEKENLQNKVKELQEDLNKISLALQTNRGAIEAIAEAIIACENSQKTNPALDLNQE